MSDAHAKHKFRASNKPVSSPLDSFYFLFGFMLSDPIRDPILVVRTLPWEKGNLFIWKM